MKLCVSALAWNMEEERSAFEILKHHHIQYVELIPSRAFKLEKKREILNEFNLRAVAFQALLFGTSGLHLFETEEQKIALGKYLEKICGLAAQLGVKALVFGSPQNRSYDEKKINREKAYERARAFFIGLNEAAKKNNTFLCLETNPPQYKCNFLTQTQETVDFIKSLGASNIKLNFDLGAININREDPEQIWLHANKIIGHFHISEPNLAEVGSQDEKIHIDMAKILKKSNYRGVLSIEMKRSQGDWQQSLSRALQFVRRVYFGS